MSDAVVDVEVCLALRCRLLRASKNDHLAFCLCGLQLSRSILNSEIGQMDRMRRWKEERQRVDADVLVL